MIRKGSKDSVSIREIQSLAKNFPEGRHLVVDGRFGPYTEKIIKSIQKEGGLVADGIVGFKTLLYMLTKKDPVIVRRESKKYLSDMDIERVAHELTVDVPAVKAVIEVESNGKGFRDNMPVILFEGHVFWKRLQKHGIDPSVYNTNVNRNILYQKWERTYYNQSQWARLRKAKKIHREAALESASWGLFQIMGYHWKNLHYRNVEEFVKLMSKSEGEQLTAFARFVRYAKLVGKLQKHDWAGFARGYNGPGYKKNNYDVKLKKAYKKYSGRQ